MTWKLSRARLAAAILLLLGCSDVGAQVGGNLNGGGSGKTPSADCGDSSHALNWNNTTKVYGCQSITGSAAAGGSTTQVQRNNAGALGGISGVISDGTKMTFSASALELSGSTSGTVVLNAPATGGGTLTLPGGTTTIAAASNNLSFFSSTTSAQLATLLSDETGSGALVFGTNPTIASPTFTGTVAGAATIPNTVLVNNAITIGGASTALGSSVTTTTILDSLCTTRGAVLYRGASGWACLSPGTSGYSLASNGPSADPTYQNIIGGGGSVSVTSASNNIVITPSPGTGTFTIGAQYLQNAQTGTTYTLVAADGGKLVTGNNAASQTFTFPASNAGSGIDSGYSTDLLTLGAGAITPSSTSAFAPGAPVLAKGQSASFTSQGSANSWLVSNVTVPFMGADTVLGNPSGSAAWPTAIALTSCSSGSSALTYNTSTHAFGCNTISGSGTVNSGTSGQIAYYASTGSAVSGTNAGTGVITALGVNLSAAGGLTSTVASGTSALGTSAISSGACATVVTTSATNVATTDVITAGFNGDPTAVTGYTPSTSGMLTIIAYPTANNVNFKVCNNTSSSITPGAITLNWRVVR